MTRVTAEEIHRAVAWAAANGHTWHPRNLDLLLANYLGGTITKQVEGKATIYFREAPALRRVK